MFELKFHFIGEHPLLLTTKTSLALGGCSCNLDLVIFDSIFIKDRCIEYFFQIAHKWMPQDLTGE